MRKIVSVFVGVLMFLGFSTQACNAATKIKFAVATPPGAHLTRAAEDFKKFIEEKSKGKYTVDLFIWGSYGASDTVFAAIQFGELQMALESTSNLSQFAPELAVFDMPYLMPSTEAVLAVTEGDLGKEVLSYLDKKNVHSLGYFFIGNRYIISNKKLSTAADLKGLKHRTTASPYHIASIRSLGLSPIPIAATELVTSLQQGVVDTADVEINWMVVGRGCDLCKYILNSEHLANLYAAYCSQEWIDSLSKDDRSLFDEGFALMMKNGKQYSLDSIQESLDILVNKENCVYTELSPEEKAKLVEMSREAYKALPADIRALATKISDASKSLQ